MALSLKPATEGIKLTSIASAATLLQKVLDNIISLDIVAVIGSIKHSRDKSKGVSLIHTCKDC